MVSAKKLAELFKEMGCEDVRAFEEIPKAFEEAYRLKGKDGMLFCVGSLYLVGEIKRVIRRNA